VLKGAALFQPFAVDTRQSRKQVSLLVFDCVAFLVVRDGSVVFTVGERQHPIAFGHAVLIAPRTVFTYEPEGTATLTTLLVDVDYMLDQLYWQWAAPVVRSGLCVSRRVPFRGCSGEWRDPRWLVRVV